MIRSRKKTSQKPTSRRAEPRAKKSRARLNTLKATISRRDFYIPVLASLVTVTVIVLGVIFLPKLFRLAWPEKSDDDICRQSIALYEEVKSFSFAYGGDSKLAKKLQKAIDNPETEPACLYYDYMAVAEYYYGVRKFDNAIAFAEEASNYLGNSEEDWVNMTNFYIKAYNKQGDIEQRDYWQQQLDDYNTEPEGCEDEEAEAEASE